MSKDLKFKCVVCGAENLLQESVLAEYENEVQARVQTELRTRIAAIESREGQIEAVRKQLAEKDASVTAARAQIDAEVKAKVDAERARVVEEERKKASEAVAARISSLELMNSEKDIKLAGAEQKELNLLREKAALDAEKRRIELTVAQMIDVERQTIYAKAQQDAEELLRSKVTEKDLVIESMKKQIEELRRRSEQGSQQLQGEAQEVDLLDILSSAFKHDMFERIAKGQLGGDILQDVNVTGGFRAGRILTESKRTKAWSENWIEKAKSDQRDAKADLVVIVTTALPKGVTSFECIDGVWVTGLSCAVNLIGALRWALIETATARFALQKRDSRMEAVYAYLTGGEFRERVRAIVENITLLQDGLTAEKRFMERSWACQAKQIERLTVAAAGMYGDLQGVIGSSLPQVDGLDMPMLEAAPETSSEDAADNDEETSF